MDIVSLLISLLSGAVGGNIAGAVMQERSLGTLGNSLVGILGGGLGATVLQALGIAASASAGSGARRPSTRGIATSSSSCSAGAGWARCTRRATRGSGASRR